MRLTLCGGESYIKRLADYIRNAGRYEISIFTEASAFVNHMEGRRRNEIGDSTADKDGERFLIEESFLTAIGNGENIRNRADTIFAGLSADRVYCLTEQREKDGLREGRINYLYQFQSAEILLSRLQPASSKPLKQQEEPLSEPGLSDIGAVQAARSNRADTAQQLIEEVRTELEILPGISDEAVYEYIDSAIAKREKKQKISLKGKPELRKDIFNSIRRLDVLQNYIDDDSVTEIMVNGLHSIFVEKEGRLLDTGRAFSSKERLGDIIQQIVAGANRTVNTASPIVDARLPDGARVNVVLDPIAVNGPILTIRRFPKTPITDRMLLEKGSVTEELLTFLQKLVAAKYNIIISGGTGSGKTTFLNVLSEYIPKTERIITIEDSAELQIRGIENLVRLETRNANVEGCKPITIRDLIKASLRMRPDRVVVGEVRGEEAIDMLQAMNVGMDGSLSTIHANSAKDAILRLEAMMLLSTEVPIAAIRSQIASGVDLIVQLGRLRDKSRHLLEVIEVLGYDGKDVLTQALYSFREEGESENGRIIGSILRENELFHREKLYKAGIAV